MAFSFPLFSVPVAFVLCYIPHFVRVALALKANAYDNKDPRNPDKIKELSQGQADLQRRLMGAHLNQLESIGMYAAGIVASVFRRGDRNWLINFLPALYIGLRVAYIASYVGPPVAGGYLRSVIFVGCLGTIMAIWIRAFV